MDLTGCRSPGTRDLKILQASRRTAPGRLLVERRKRDNLDIYVKLVGPGPPPLRLTSDAANDSNPAWSPDGRFIAFKRALPGGRHLVQLIAPTGGPERTVNAGQISPNVNWLTSSIAWTPDGRSLLIIHQDGPDRPAGVFLLPLDGHEKRRLTSPSPGSWDAFPALSPDGRTLAFSRMNRNAANGIFIVPLSSDLRPQGAPKTIMSDTVADGLAWTVDGHDVIAGALVELRRRYPSPMADCGRWVPDAAAPLCGERVRQSRCLRAGRARLRLQYHGLECLAARPRPCHGGTGTTHLINSARSQRAVLARRHENRVLFDTLREP